MKLTEINSFFGKRHEKKSEKRIFTSRLPAGACPQQHLESITYLKESKRRFWAREFFFHAIFLIIKLVQACSDLLL